MIILGYEVATKKYDTWIVYLLTSKLVHFLLMIDTSVACKGATACLTVTLIFLVLFHFSGSSCKVEQLNALKAPFNGAFYSTLWYFTNKPEATPKANNLKK